MRLASRRTLRSVLSAALFLTALVSAAVHAQEGLALLPFFPKSDEVTGWRLQGQPKLFPGPRVFDYMDGAGEIPRSYGLSQLGSVLYRKGTVTLEAAIFDMKSPAGAYGYASIRGFLDRSPTGKDRTVLLDHPARLNPRIGILTFWKGHYTVILQPQEGKPDDAALVAFAKLLSRRLPGGGGPPSLLRFLPTAGAQPGTARYVRGHAAFDASLVFSAQDALGAANGAEAVAEEAQLPGAVATLAVVKYSDATAARAAFEGFRGLLKEHNADFSPGATATRYTAFSPKEKGAGALLDGNRLALVLFAGGPKGTATNVMPAVRVGLQRLQASLRRPGPLPK
jgi:hypothetical protein